VIRYAGGVRRIFWNPIRRVKVPMPRTAQYRQRGTGAPVEIGRSALTLRVSYLPIMVESRR
jgi:hypothetical protein